MKFSPGEGALLTHWCLQPFIKVIFFGAVSTPTINSAFGWEKGKDGPVKAQLIWFSLLELLSTTTQLKSSAQQQQEAKTTGRMDLHTVWFTLLTCSCWQQMFQITAQLVATISPDSLNKLCDFKSWCMTRNLSVRRGIAVPALSVFVSEVHLSSHCFNWFHHLH